ncbi:MAG: transporter substrate-binding domain-containing protein [Pseudomonadota bacterium]
MPILRTWRLFLLLLVYCPGSSAAGGEIVFIAPLSSAMPFARFADGQLSAGILKDLGDAIAGKLGREARFVSIPGKRVGQTLSAGLADGVCNVMPAWIPGDFAWSRPLIPNAGVVVSRSDAPVIRTIGDLAGLRVGTVLGYRYPSLEPVIGKLFIREDARTVEQVFLKMHVGRNKHSIVERREFEYELHTNKASTLREDLVYETYKTSCAFSRASKIAFADIDQAIAALVSAGAVDAIIARYR